MAKSMNIPELHYPMIQFLIIVDITYTIAIDTEGNNWFSIHQSSRMETPKKLIKKTSENPSQVNSRGKREAVQEKSLGDQQEKSNVFRMFR